MKKYTLAQGLVGTSAPLRLQSKLEIADVPYIDLDGQVQLGQFVVHQSVAVDIEKIMQKILLTRFPIERVEPVVAYNWDDESSMSANNSSAFNYRTVSGQQRLSWHSYGLAVDINPLWNPYIRDDLHQPAGSVYDATRPGTILADSSIVAIFKQFGWQWGGDCWDDRVDYQHFQKPDEALI